MQADGTPISMIGTVLDITELEVARSELRQTEERWKLALGSMGLGVWDWDLDTGRVIYTDALLAMLGYQPGEWKDRAESWASMVHPDDYPEASAAVRRCMKGECPGICFGTSPPMQGWQMELGATCGAGRRGGRRRKAAAHGWHPDGYPDSQKSRTGFFQAHAAYQPHPPRPKPFHRRGGGWNRCSAK